MLTADVNRLGYIGRKPGAVPADRDADSWYTPASYIEAARVVMDGIDLDPFSSEKANSTIRATRILTEDRSAFSTSWRPNKHKYPKWCLQQQDPQLTVFADFESFFRAANRELL